MKKIYSLVFIVISFMIFQTIDKFEKDIKINKEVYKYGVYSDHSFEVNKEEFKEYQNTTKNFNTYIYQEGVYYANFNKNSNEPFLNLNVDEINKILAEKNVLVQNHTTKIAP